MLLYIADFVSSIVRVLL